MFCKKGYSKDGKPQRSQVLLALLVTTTGIPVGYEVFAGNTYAGHTLLDTVKKIQQDYQINTLAVVAATGLLNRHNQQALAQSKRPISWVIGSKQRVRQCPMPAQILDKAAIVNYS